MQRVMYGIAGSAILVALWWVLVASGAVPQQAFPLPHEVATAMVDLLGDSRFWEGMWQTVQAWVFGVGMAALIGIPVGIAAGSAPRLRKMVTAIIELGRPIPAVALIPVGILLFGIGNQMKIALTFYALIWIFLLQAIYGLRAVDTQLVHVARSLHWGRVRTMLFVRLPSAAPYVATALRLSTALGLIIVLTAELLGASTGVGVLLRDFRTALRPDFALAVVFLVGALGIMVNALLVVLERYVLFWAPSSQVVGR